MVGSSESEIRQEYEQALKSSGLSSSSSSSIGAAGIAGTAGSSTEADSAASSFIGSTGSTGSTLTKVLANKVSFATKEKAAACLGRPILEDSSWDLETQTQAPQAHQAHTQTQAAGAVMSDARNMNNEGGTLETHKHNQNYNQNQKEEGKRSRGPSLTSAREMGVEVRELGVSATDVRGQADLALQSVSLKTWRLVGVDPSYRLLEGPTDIVLPTPNTNTTASNASNASNVGGMDTATGSNSIWSALAAGGARMPLPPREGEGDTPAGTGASADAGTGASTGDPGLARAIAQALNLVGRGDPGFGLGSGPPALPTTLSGATLSSDTTNSNSNSYSGAAGSADGKESDERDQVVTSTSSAFELSQGSSDATHFHLQTPFVGSITGQERVYSLSGREMPTSYPDLSHLPLQYSAPGGLAGLPFLYVIMFMFYGFMYYGFMDSCIMMYHALLYVY